MVKYSSSVLAAANLLALAQALPAQPVCSVVVQVVTGYGVWVPQPDPTWGSWDDPKKPAASTTSTASWSEWTEDPSKGGKPSTKKTTTTTDWNTWDPNDPAKPKPTSKTTTTAEWSGWAGWGDEGAKPTSTSTTKNGGGFYPAPTSGYLNGTTSTLIYSTLPYTITTTTTESTTTAESTTTTTTTTETPSATSCPYYDGSSHSVLNNVQGGGSCDSTFTVQCGARVNVPTDGSVNFWERHSGETVGSLAECIAICDSNSDCTAAIWTDYEGAGPSDKFHCWQTSGLPQPSNFGNSGTYGQLSYKGSSKGQCDGYNTPQ